MALPQTPEQNKLALEAQKWVVNSGYHDMLKMVIYGADVPHFQPQNQMMGSSQLANQQGALYGYGRYRQAPSTLPGYSTNTPNHGPGAYSFSTAAFQALGARGPSGMGIFAWDASPPEPIEDVGIRPGEVRAYRCWRWQHGFLQSMAMDDIWAPGEPMVGKTTDHTGGGVHAWRTMSKALGYAMPYATGSDYGGGSIIVGQVDLWGDIVEHEHGYRAEFAAIVSLDSVLGADKQMLETLRERYGI